MLTIRFRNYRTRRRKGLLLGLGTIEQGEGRVYYILGLETIEQGEISVYLGLGTIELGEGRVYY